MAPITNCPWCSWENNDPEKCSCVADCEAYGNVCYGGKTPEEQEQRKHDLGLEKLKSWRNHVRH